MNELEIKPIDLREVRRHKLNAWLVSKSKDRWESDDGRILRLDEFNFWPDYIKEAEQKYFKQIDAEYELNKLK
jgi:hypothetical protein